MCVLRNSEDGFATLCYLHLFISPSKIQFGKGFPIGQSTKHFLRGRLGVHLWHNHWIHWHLEIPQIRIPPLLLLTIIGAEHSYSGTSSSRIHFHSNAHPINLRIHQKLVGRVGQLADVQVSLNSTALNIVLINFLSPCLLACAVCYWLFQAWTTC